MKNTHICPKCRQRRIWVIERFRIPSEGGEGRELAVVPHQQEQTRTLFGSMRASPKGAFDMFVCDGCGYSELWARDLRGLVADEANGIKLVDNSNLGEGPFR